MILVYTLSFLFQMFNTKIHQHNMYNFLLNTNPPNPISHSPRIRRHPQGLHARHMPVVDVLRPDLARRRLEPPRIPSVIIVVVDRRCPGEAAATAGRAEGHRRPVVDGHLAAVVIVQVDGLVLGVLVDLRLEARVARRGIRHFRAIGPADLVLGFHQTRSLAREVLCSGRRLNVRLGFSVGTRCGRD